MSPEPFDSRAKALPAKRSEKGYGDENEGKEHKFRGFPEGSPHASFVYFMATAKEMAMCNDLNCTRA